MTTDQTTTRTVTVRLAMAQAQVQALDDAVTAMGALIDTLRGEAVEQPNPHASCGRDVGDASPCRCVLLAEHPGSLHACRHTLGFDL